VEKFLRGLSGEYETLRKEINSSYVIDRAAKHFTRVRLQRLVETVTEGLETGKVEDATAEVNKFGKVELGTGSVVNVLEDDEALRAALEDDVDDIVTYPGALGSMLRNQLTRDAFVVFMAPEKRGKSFWLIDIGWRAILQRRRVAWFAAGDMSERQMLRRFAARAAGRPVKAKHWPHTVLYPTKMRRVENEVQVKHEERVFDAPLSFRDAKLAFQETAQYRVRGKEYLRFVAHPNSTLSVKGIDAQLEIWAREGWVPDVVVVDYADILDEAAADPTATSSRDRINASWKQQRGLSSKWHVLYVTATQSDTDSFTTEIIRRTNFSEDKRKLSHVTGLLGINQNDAEKKLEVYRLNWVVLREGEYVETDTVAVAACLAMSNPAVRSCF